MIHKRILVPRRLRRPPATGWSWLDRQFLKKHADHLSRDALLLYLFLSAVADKHGVSFYGDATLAARLRVALPAIDQARLELVRRDLIAFQPPLTQVLSLPPDMLYRREEPGQGLMRLGDLFRQAETRSPSNTGRDMP